MSCDCRDGILLPCLMSLLAQHHEHTITLYQKRGGVVKKKSELNIVLGLESVVCLLATGTNCLLGGQEKFGQLQFNLGKMDEQAINRTGVLTTQMSIHLDESHNKNQPSLVISGLALGILKDLPNFI